MSRVWDEPIRDRSNVINLRQRVSRHPSQPAMFDQTKQPADRTFVLTVPVAHHIASLLNAARPHLPSPKAVDSAIELLTGRPART